MIKIKTNQQGIAALVVIVIVAAVGLLVAQSASFLGLGELGLGYTSQKGGEAFALADGCMEEAFRRIRLDTSYTGNPSLTVVNGSCTISVVVSGSDRTITVIGNTTDEYYATIESQISLFGNVITINSWAQKEN